jgi:thiol-disulfide isomerase/thioredoxin
MKKPLLFLLLIFAAFAMQAKDGYKIKVHFKQDIPDSVIYLARYFAKPPPTIYKIDSGKVIGKRTAVIETRDSILGGIYMILFANNSKFTDILVDNGVDMEITIDTANMPTGNIFKGSEENTRHVAFQKEAEKFGKQVQELQAEMAKASTHADSLAIHEKSKKISADFKRIRRDYAKKYKGTLLASVFDAIDEPEVPEGTHYLEDGKTVDSLFAFKYTKAHYWDKFDFNDNRLIIAPFYERKLSTYFNNYVLPIPDTVLREADTLLARTRNAKELFKYTLHWLAGWSEKNKLMGLDEVFVGLVDKYYSQGDAYWLDSAQLAKYIERAQAIAPTVIGAPAQEIVFQDIYTLQDVSLRKMDAPYTLLVFWSFDCGHCAKEIPQIDSVYRAALKDYGVKVYSVGGSSNGEATITDLQNFVEKHKLNGWTHVANTKGEYDTRKLYDTYSL